MKGKKFHKIGICHTKVTMEKSEDICEWQRHAICHRPILVCWEFERDLTDEEQKMLEKEPIILEFELMMEGVLYKIKYPMKIDYKQASKAGKHGCLIYLNTKATDIKVLPELGGIIPCHNGFNRFTGSYHREVRMKSDLPKALSTFTPKGDGLFKGNPIISMDMVRPEEVIADKMKEMKTEYLKEFQKKGGRFLLSIVNGEEALGWAWDIAVDYTFDGKLTTEQKLELSRQAVGGVESLLTNIMDKVDNAKFLEIAQENLSKGIAIYDRALSIFTLSKEMIQLTADYQKKASEQGSPFRMGTEHGKSTFLNDSFFLVSTQRKYYSLTGEKKKKNEKTEEPPIYELVEVDNFLTPYLDREMPAGQTVFHIQFGDYSGLLTREEKNYNDKDSLWPMFPPFQEKLLRCRQIIFGDDKGGMPAGEYLQKLASEEGSQHLGQRFDLAKANKKLVDYLSEKGVSKELKAKLEGKETKGANDARANSFGICLQNL